MLVVVLGGRVVALVLAHLTKCVQGARRGGVAHPQHCFGNLQGLLELIQCAGVLFKEGVAHPYIVSALGLALTVAPFQCLLQGRQVNA